MSFENKMSNLFHKELCQRPIPIPVWCQIPLCMMYLRYLRNVADSLPITIATKVGPTRHIASHWPIVYYETNNMT